ncbi:hypothetical protein [Candidatus Hodgkinia cicadicola]|uniref:hypothetical protein n=1 Tax=Candidatus Hodgkinia cicadicola TaxID=573658 RepID=UPI002414EA14
MVEIDWEVWGNWRFEIRVGVVPDRNLLDGSKVWFNFWMIKEWLMVGSFCKDIRSSW